MYNNTRQISSLFVGGIYDPGFASGSLIAMVTAALLRVHGKAESTERVER
jgi:hypothetical protein